MDKLTQMIPVEGWRAVYRTDAPDPFYYMARLVGWALTALGGIEGLVVTPLGITPAAEVPGFITYMHEQEFTTAANDKILTMLRAEGRARNGWSS